MYTTRPLSLYKNAPEAISLPPEGPHSGHLVLQDEESTRTYCFGLCKNPSIDDLPFPQNKLTYVKFHVNSDQGGYNTYDAVYLIPVVNQPLSSNRYYVIKADGNHKGDAYASSKEEDECICCFFFTCVRDVKPRPLDPDDIYQQFEFSLTKTWANRNMLVAKSVAPDGHPPLFLRRKGWRMTSETPKNFTLGEANGVDAILRAHHPDFRFPLSQESSNSVVVGKWYCPFMFIKEGTLMKDQVKKSVFYEMTLEQRWERIFATQNGYYPANKPVNIDVVVPTLMVRIGGNEAVHVEHNDGTEIVWFMSIDGNKEGEEVGLSRLIVERMMWEEERVGWVKGKEKKVRVVKEEEYGGIMWSSYGCYVLVESFVLRRNDGSLVLTYDFMHTHKLRSKWE